MSEYDNIGADWLAEECDGLTEELDYTPPAAWNEMHRYLPDSVTPQPGYMSFRVNPFMEELVDNFDPRSDVRETILCKGVQTTYTTALESVLLYYIAKVKTAPSMLLTADRDLAKARVENYILPMLEQSGFSDLIVSSDEGNSRKTGKTSNHLQWRGGGFLVPYGANNANKMRSFSIRLLLRDEVDGWPYLVGKDGNPMTLTADRCSAFWDYRKIFTGSTPLLFEESHITEQYERGDKRKYHVPCRGCGQLQELRWEVVNEETGLVGGFTWEYDDRGVLDQESVRYVCPYCGHAHREYDKTWMFAKANGAKWIPTCAPEAHGIRSYLLPAFYSPVGFQPWHKCVEVYLAGYDVAEGKVKDPGKYQVFYNNILGKAFKRLGASVTLEHVSAHRRDSYRSGVVPNGYAERHSGGKILFLTCQVDVHKHNLAVSVMGWTQGLRCYVIEYWRFEDEDGDCSDPADGVWQRVRDLVEAAEWEADDGTKYRLVLTLVDAGYANATVVNFCAEYTSGVVPILGRERPAKAQRILEFAPFVTTAQTTGYRVLVDHYKDRLSPVLRRDWTENDNRTQGVYHFNAPADITTAQLTELTVEKKVKKLDDRGNTSYIWYRPPGSKNELWDLLVYGNAAVEMLAYMICIEHFELENVDWSRFWEYCALPEQDALFQRQTAGTTGAGKPGVVR